ncbi:hypothetical protein T484DRAFT_1902534 [Baffinella frigidus]|nr:hypothetical protein T484DRAFT_1902534 [Cryptophyta sp. CCMP2293]
MIAGRALCSKGFDDDEWPAPLGEGEHWQKHAERTFGERGNREVEETAKQALELLAACTTRGAANHRDAFESAARLIRLALGPPRAATLGDSGPSSHPFPLYRSAVSRPSVTGVSRPSFGHERGRVGTNAGHEGGRVGTNTGHEGGRDRSVDDGGSGPAGMLLAAVKVVMAASDRAEDGHADGHEDGHKGGHANGHADGHADGHEASKQREECFALLARLLGLLGGQAVLRTKSADHPPHGSGDGGDVLEELLGEAVEGIARLAERCTHLAPRAVEVLVPVCMEDKAVLLLPGGPLRTRLRARASEGVCRALRARSLAPGDPTSELEESLHAIAAVLFRDAGAGSVGGGGAARRQAVMLLGRIAERAEIPHATEVVQGLMMEGLQSLPPSLHAELLQQLTAIALVPPHAHYKSVADFLFARYARPFAFDTCSNPDATALRHTASPPPPTVSVYLGS